MNHPSEWMKTFDERAGRYRYKHKGSGVIRDSLTTIGNKLKKGVAAVAKKGATTVAKKAVQSSSKAARNTSSQQKTCPESIVASRCYDDACTNFGKTLKIFNY